MNKFVDLGELCWRSAGFQAPSQTVRLLFFVPKKVSSFGAHGATFYCFSQDPGIFCVGLELVLGGIEINVGWILIDLSKFRIVFV